MMVRHSRLLVLACMALSACDTASSHKGDDAAPKPEPTASAKVKTSIMRPSIVEPTPAAPSPRLEPVRMSVHFKAGEAGLGDDARAALDAALERIKALAGPIAIRGHTDSRGNDLDNKRMSEQRAQAVRDYLAEKGVASERMTVIGLGEDRPVAPNAMLNGEDDAAGRQKNRRVDIVAEPPRERQAKDVPAETSAGQDQPPPA